VNDATAGVSWRALNSPPFDMDLSNDGLNDYSLPRHVLKRLMAEYRGFDAAGRLCADYCITANDLAALIRVIPKPERSKSSLMSNMRSDKFMDIGEAYLAAR
jgi:hypothetical protein